MFGDSLDITRSDNDVLHTRIFRMQPDPLALRFRIVGLQRCFIAHKRNHNIAAVCMILFSHNDHIALINPGIHHGMSMCPQHKEISLTEKGNRKSDKFLKVFFRQFG